MKFGIYYAYWADKWGVDYHPFIDKVADLGYDVLEISCAGLCELDREERRSLRDHARDRGILLTGGYGPKKEENLSSLDEATVENGLRFWEATFQALEDLGITVVGGGLYGYWPVDYQKPFDKERELESSIRNMRRMADLGADHGMQVLGMEVLNRHEGYLLNDAKEAVAYCRAVDKPNVKVHLDTYHMLLEEDSMSEAIHTAGSLLGHVHVGENNRKLPGQGHFIDWEEIGRALHEVGYEGNVVAEPFVIHGGEVGRDIRLWRDLFPGIGQEKLDRDAAESVRFLRKAFGE